MKKLLLGILALAFASSAYTQTQPASDSTPQTLSNKNISCAANTLTGLQSQCTNVDVLAKGALCDGHTNDQAAFQAAANVGIGYIGIQLPANKTCLLTSGITISNPGVVFVGAGSTSSAIVFAPTTNGAALFTFSAGAAQLFNSGLKGVGILSNDTTHTKTAVLLEDTASFYMDDVAIGYGGVNWTGGSGATNPCSGVTDIQSGSVGIRICGRQAFTGNKISIAADQNIEFSINPNSTVLSADHFHFQDLQLVDVSPQIANPLILVDPGVVLTNDTFDGYQAWVGGTYGLYDANSTAPAVSYALHISNVRWEQGSNSADYGIYINQTSHQFQQIHIDNFHAASSANGIFCAGCYDLSIDTFTLPLAFTAFHFDNTDFTIGWTNAEFGASTTMNVSGQTLVHAVYQYPSTAVPSSAILANTTSSFASADIFGASPSATSPQIAGDPTSGFYSPAADDVREACAGSVCYLNAYGDVIIGNNAGNAMIANIATTTTNNVFIGTNAGADFLPSATACGSFTAGADNIAIGGGAMLVNVGGCLNTVVGVDSGRTSTSGSFNALYGVDADQLGNGFSFVTAIGERACAANNASSTTCLGYQSLQAATNGLGNTALGSYAAQSLTTGNYETAVGEGAMQVGIALTSTGDGNTAVGYQAAYNTTGTENAALGYLALNTNTGGQRNTAIGDQANFSNLSGNFNTGAGDSACYTNSTGSFNSCLGFATGPASGALSSTVCIGSYCSVSSSFHAVFGGANANGALTDFTFGQGETFASAATVTMHTTAGTGSNNVGAGLILASGASTGNATPTTVVIQSPHVGSTGSTAQTLTTRETFGDGTTTEAQPLALQNYTVATLPTCSSSVNKYAMAVVTDALAPTYNGALTGSSTTIVPVFCNGTAWTAH